MTDKQTLKEMQKALSDDWRTIKNLVENHDNMSDEEIGEELGDLQVDMVLENGDTIKNLIE